jgi:hypothetical protein
VASVQNIAYILFDLYYLLVNSATQGTSKIHDDTKILMAFSVGLSCLFCEC